MWFYDNWGRGDGSLVRKLTTALHCAIFVIGFFVLAAGVSCNVDPLSPVRPSGFADLTFRCSCVLVDLRVYRGYPDRVRG